MAVSQTAAHERHNETLLRMMPTNARAVVEVGCSSGALAREYKRSNSACRYVGVEVMPDYAALARRYCDTVLELDIERVDEEFLRDTLAADCWVFGDSLEHLSDPWSLLARIRSVIPADGCIAACIPNAQNWSVQVRLNSGAFRYEDSGLLDRSHLRWFTRLTIIELFAQARFRIVEAQPIFLEGALREKVLPAIRLMASSTGADPEAAVRDALPFQYVVRAVPE